MAKRPHRACPVCRVLNCGIPSHDTESRERERKRVVAARQRAGYRPYSSAERREHERIIDAHVAAHGWWCPGAPDLDHAPHLVAPNGLDVDHIIPVGAGGQRVGGPKRVLCRAMNRGRR